MSAPVPSPFSRPASSSAPGLLSVADFNKLATYPSTYVAPPAQVVSSVASANGLSLSGGALSMSLASGGGPGAISASDFSKLAGYPAYSAPAVTSVATGNGLNLAAGVLSMSAPAVSSVTQANGLTLSAGVLAIALASGATSGTVSGAAQSFNGVKTFASAPVFSAGAQSSSFWNTNGTTSGDVAVRLGFSTADGSVNSGAKPLQIGTGINGTFVEKGYFLKGGSYVIAPTGIGFGPSSELINVAGGVWLDNSSNIGFFNLNGAVSMGLNLGNGVAYSTATFRAGGPLETYQGYFNALSNTTARLTGTLGAGSTDLVGMIGSTVADGSVHSSARLFTVRAGINGTEVEYFSVKKSGLDFYSGGLSVLNVDTFGNLTVNAQNSGSGAAALVMAVPGGGKVGMAAQGAAGVTLIQTVQDFVGVTSRLYSSGDFTTAGAVESTTNGKGFVLKDSGGARWRITVSTGGALSAVAA